MKYFQAHCVDLQVSFAGVSYQAKRVICYCGQSSQAKPVVFLVLWVLQEDRGRDHWEMAP